MINNSMKKIILGLILFVLISPQLTFAQTSPTSETAVILGSIEEERNKKLELELGLTIPLETDNPNHILTFKDPSGKGVKLEIDGGGYKAIKSPYTLPSLGVGSHILSFKFVDKEQTSQTLEKDLVVVPRPPVINAPENITKTEVTLKGTSLASSTVEIFISGGTQNFKASTNVNVDGTWTYKFKEGFKDEVFTVIARTKKNGFSSTLSEPIVFEIKGAQTNNIDNTQNKPTIYFNFNSIDGNNVIDTFKKNPHLLVLILLSGIIGAVITSVIESNSTRKVNKTAEGKFIKLLNEKEVNSKKSKKDKENKTSDGKKITLKEKFEKAGFKVPQQETKEKQVSKDEFLQAFKHEDPDNPKGVEKREQPKDDKKKVAVSLTTPFRRLVK